MRMCFLYSSFRRIKMCFSNLLSSNMMSDDHNYVTAASLVAVAKENKESFKAKKKKKMLNPKQPE